jgi:hypothetical protein
MSGEGDGGNEGDRAEDPRAAGETARSHSGPVGIHRQDLYPDRSKLTIRTEGTSEGKDLHATAGGSR